MIENDFRTELNELLESVKITCEKFANINSKIESCYMDNLSLREYKDIVESENAQRIFTYLTYLSSLEQGYKKRMSLGVKP